MTFTIVAALIAVGAAAQAGPPASDPAKDRAAAVQYLEQTRDNFLKSIEGVSEAQWKFKAGPDRWSIAEVAEHIAVSESTLFEMILGKVMQAPAPAPGGARVSDERLIAGITNRAQAAQAPEMLRPTNRWATKEALTKDFLAARQKTIDYVKSSTGDLRAHAAPFPAFKADLDGHQWMLFLAGHSARHTAQIDEVKTSPGYPVK